MCSCPEVVGVLGGGTQTNGLCRQIFYLMKSYVTSNDLLPNSCKGVLDESNCLTTLADLVQLHRISSMAVQCYNGKRELLSA